MIKIEATRGKISLVDVVLLNMVWFISLTVWSLILFPLGYTFAKPRSAQLDQWEQRWEPDKESFYYYDAATRTLKRRS